MRYKLLAPLALAFAATLSAQTEPTVPLELELGYRWVEVTGNEQMYRTQINDRPGVLLRSLNFTSNAPLDGVLDYFRVDATDIGAGPAGALRLTAGQQNLFQLNFSWRRTNLYSALPAFANPFLDDGIVPGQQTWNRTRNIYDVGLELFPGKMFTPILGYTRNVYGGPGRTTYHLGSDEFALNDDVKAVDDEYRIGLRVDAGAIQGAVIQGWRKYHYNDLSTLVPGAGAGNNDGTVLGQTEFADAISRTTETEINTPATSAWVTGQLFGRVKLIGSYIRADASADTNSLEGDLGNFVSFRISRFFSGLEEPITSTANTDYWRGSARAEIQIFSGIELSGGWMQKSRQLTGSALAASLYLDAVTFGGVSEGDLLRIVETNTSLDRDDTTFDVTISAVRLGPFSVNAGWSQTQQEVAFGSEFSSLVIPGEPAGEYQRTVNTYGAGFTFAMFGVRSAATTAATRPTSPSCAPTSSTGTATSSAPSGPGTAGSRSAPPGRRTTATTTRPRSSTAPRSASSSPTSS